MTHRKTKTHYGNINKMNEKVKFQNRIVIRYKNHSTYMKFKTKYQNDTKHHKLVQQTDKPTSKTSS